MGFPPRCYVTPTTIEYIAFFFRRPLATFISLLFCKEVAFEDGVSRTEKIYELHRFYDDNRNELSDSGATDVTVPLLPSHPDSSE
jgi:hypothetical protein